MPALPPGRKNSVSIAPYAAPVTSYTASETAPGHLPHPPLRLWVYTNFDCNLACTYCLTSSSPAAERRALSPRAYFQLIDEAVSVGIDEVFLTGGEPFLLPDIFEKLAYAAERLPTTVLTNGMLLKRQRLELLRALSHLPITLQVSLDGHIAEIHDAYRGAGSWASTVAAIRSLRASGFPVAIGATETPVNSPYTEELRAFVRELGIPEQAFFLRPLTKRGFSHEGIELRAEDVSPELTVTAEGVFWHPQSAGEAMLLSRDIFPLRTALQLMQTNLEVIAAGGPVPQQYRCA
jgi:MoaA/NifB/PqqE/SkfB family radical SAM enzyme